MNFKEASELFQRAQNKERGYSLENNTRLVKTAAGFGVKLHETIVVELLPNGNFVLNTGGWFTNTTKARISSYAPVSLYSHKRIWYIGSYKPNTDIAFCDTIVVNSKGAVVKNPNAKQVEKFKKLQKSVETYVKGFSKALENKTVPVPSAGDCWGCCMVDIKTGKPVMGKDHLLQHLEEKYYVPSLLVNAIKAKGYKPEYVNPWNELRSDSKLFTRAIRDYLLKELRSA